jgi:hypothetical protein
MQRSMMSRRLMAGLTFFTVIGCSQSLAPAGEPDFDGVVLEVRVGQSAVTLLVDQVQPERFSWEGRNFVTVHPTTRVVTVSAQGTTSPAAAADVPTGSRVRIKTNGAEGRSGPPHYDAVWVEVLLDD